MNVIKRALIVFLTVLSLFALSSCGESDAARLRRLENDAAQKRQEAQEARDNYNKLKDFVDKYGNH